MKRITEQKSNGELVVPESLMTGRPEFDNWFSRFGGIVLGSSIYVTGTSGGGKSTLMANIMTWFKDDVTAMYSREMLKKYLLDQVRDLTFTENAYLSDVEDNPTFDSFMKDVYDIKPKILIVDSLQVIAKEDYVLTGLMSEDMACYKIIKELRDYVNKNNAVLFLIGHNTKDGVFAGANTNMQMIDAHIDIVYNKENNSRTMSWGQKNRKGPMGTIPFSIQESQILFSLNKNEETEKSFNVFSESCNYIENAINNEFLLSNFSDDIKKKFVKKLEAEKKKNKKESFSITEELSKNVQSWLNLNLQLKTGNL